MSFKPSCATKLLLALGVGTNIGTTHLIPIPPRGFHRGNGKFGGKIVVKSTNEILREVFLRRKAIGRVGRPGFNRWGKNPGRQGIVSSVPMRNIGGEVVPREGSAPVVYRAGKVSLCNLALALPRFNMLGNCRNGAEQNITVGARTGSGSFGLVDLIVALTCEIICWVDEMDSWGQTCLE